MNLLADESVDKPIVDRLREDSHTVAFIAEMRPGIPDEEVLAQANALAALLITSDKDFGELVYRQRLVHHGVVLLRFLGLSASSKAALVSSALEEHGVEMQADAFSVLSPGVVRIRARTADAAD